MPQRDNVTVNGVSLTRAQVEQAMATLNTPAPPAPPVYKVPECLQRVIGRRETWAAGMTGVVITGKVQRRYAYTSNLPSSVGVTVVTNDGNGRSYTQHEVSDWAFGLASFHATWDLVR